MLGSIYGTKVIYGQRVIYLNLPYAERVMLMGGILKTFYALLPEQITEVALLPEHKTAHDPYIHYTTESEVY